MSEQNEPIFQVSKLYIKDASFQVEGDSQIFTQEWKPELNVHLNLKNELIDEDNAAYEVVLTVKCEVKTGDTKAFSTEVDQAGIFTISNMTDAQKKQTLESYCPNLLYPYAREVITDMVTKGGFPQLCLAPVNFDVASKQTNTTSAQQ